MIKQALCRTGVFAMVFFVHLSSTASAQVPQLINYQGRMVNGTNLVNGTVGLTLRLFSDFTGGTLLYAGSNQVTVVDGLYNTYIGQNTIAGNLLAALTNQSVWLEAVINGTTLSPREQIVSVAYSLTTRGLLFTTNNSLIGYPLVNSAHPSVLQAVIGGGNHNAIDIQSHYATIGGGNGNKIGTNSYYSVIGGGHANIISNNSNSSAIGGGNQNYIGPQSTHAAIAGGSGNIVSTNASLASIGGGQNNRIGVGSSSATISGGAENGIGTNSYFGVVAGGFANFIATNSYAAAMGGGGNNKIGNRSEYATISGGQLNYVGEASRHASIGGGANNEINFALYTTIGGGRENEIGLNSDYSAIGGGYQNTIANSAVRSIIAGGYNNLVDNSVQYGAVGGGSGNRILNSSLYGTVPGGRDNMASSYAFAAGRQARAIHNGSFVWGDDTDAVISSTTSNQFLIRAQHGLGVNVTSIGPGLSADFGSRVRVRGNTSGVWFYEQSLSADRGFVGMGDVNHVGIYGNSGAGWGLLMNVSNGFIGIGKYNPSNIIDVSNGAYLSVGGTWTSVSDVNRKQNFEPVDTHAILEKVAALPITIWSYTAEPGVRHIGPTAQDFHAAFGFGVNEISLSQIDPDGVALAAIQALAKDKADVRSQMSQVREAVSELEAENAKLRSELAAIKQKLGM